MTTEQFLNSLRFIDNEIQALSLERTRIADQRQELLDLAETWGGLNGICVQHSPGSRTESIGIALAMTEDEGDKIQQYQHKIYRKLGELLEKKHNALLIIEKIPDAKHRALLMHRYINNLQWSTVADLMGYTENWVKIALKEQAIGAYDKARTTT
jgi:hypothetical protein